MASTSAGPAVATVDDAVALIVSAGSDCAQVAVSVVPALRSLVQQGWPAGTSSRQVLSGSLQSGDDPLAVLASTDHFGAGFLYVL
jgi:hypothetical protein